ncbi:MAG: hypothetical protein KGL39_51270 [Patescibacteria group bacterium]|nr:hypothetical protein [Patescibacteria group bacterium]
MLKNGLPRYYADRVRDEKSWRWSDTYEIIDRTQGFMNPIKRVQGYRAMEQELARLNAS